MTAANFDRCLKLVLQHEGGNDDDPQDPGGRTSRGITQREYNAFKKGNGSPTQDVWTAPDDEINTIYKTQYWQPWGDQLPSGADYLYFDMNVNMGPAQATKLFQRSLGVSADGHMGIVTVEKIQDCTDLAGLIKSVSNRRRDFYKSLSTFSRFGRGWMRRTDEVERDATKMVPLTETTPNVTMTATTGLGDGATVKASAEDAATAPISPETAAGSATGMGGAATIVNEIQTQLAPYSQTLSWIKYILIAASLIGVGFMVWGMIKRSQVKTAMGQ